MKKLLGIIVLGFLLSGNTYAEIKLIERDNIAVIPLEMWVSRICVDGYEYLTLADIKQEDNLTAITGSITQSFEVINGKSLPKKCKWKNYF